MLNLILIYVLSLQDKKYFITEISSEKVDLIENYVDNNNITELLNFFGQGGYWLEHYPIVGIANIIEDSHYSCDEVLKGYMATYGVHNVRGCSYVDIAYEIDDFNKIIEDVNMYYEEGNSLISEPSLGHCTKKLDSLDECN